MHVSHLNSSIVLISVAGLLFLTSIFSVSIQVSAYSPSAPIQARPDSQVVIRIDGSSASGSFTCPTISGADSSSCSTNWSGYADTPSLGQVNAVSGSWKLPTLSCPNRGTTYVALWVGIDGYASSTVEQTGVLGECNRGAASYSTWYEFYPNPMVTIKSVAVKPGNIVSASVTYSSSTNKFSVKITNTNTGASFSVAQTVSGAARSSAEWIVERPATCIGTLCRLTTLANFGSPSFTASSTTIGTSAGAITSSADVAITMVGSSTGPILAEPSALSNGGASFTVSYH